MVTAIAYTCIGIALGIAAESLRHVKILKEIDSLSENLNKVDSMSTEILSLQSQVKVYQQKVESQLDSIPSQSLSPEIPADENPVDTSDTTNHLDIVQPEQVIVNVGDKVTNPSDESEKMPWDGESLASHETETPALNIQELQAQTASPNETQMPWDTFGSSQSKPKDNDATLPEVVQIKTTSPKIADSEKMPWDV